MNAKQLIKLIDGIYELRINDMPDAHRFVEKYLRNLGSLYKIGYSWIDIEEAIADYDELYMKDNELVISNYVDINYIMNLEVKSIRTLNDVIIIYVKYGN